MADFPGEYFAIIDKTAFVPSVGVPWLACALPFGVGIYRFHGIAIVRTVGAASASIAPVLSTVVSTNGIEVFQRNPTTAYATFPPGSGIMNPIEPIWFKAESTNIYLAVNPDVYGDTYVARLRVQRIQ